MINTKYQLVSPKKFTTKFTELPMDNSVIIRPTHLSICKADQRYYTGNRSKKALKEKLPMCLIHEGVGEVISDPLGQFKVGQKVVMIPNQPEEMDDFVAENYLYSSKFCGSGIDGFMQEMVAMKHDRLVPYNKIIPEIASIIELVSVAIHAITTFDIISKSSHKEYIGVWGDGSFGFIVSLLLKHKYPESQIVIYGKRKLDYFTFADIRLNGSLTLPFVDHAFECVGGEKAGDVINNIIDVISPEGTINLLGVSENPVPINTRMVLQKGLKMIGRSRSGFSDFVDAVMLLEQNPNLQNELLKIIKEVIPVSDIGDIAKAFEKDLTMPFKTVLEWNV